jgi:uncharacterized membrane protein
LDLNGFMEKKFHVSTYIIIYKFGLGMFELASGLVILFFGKQLLIEVTRLVSRELTEDPHDIIAHLSIAIVPHFFDHNTVVVISLILLGIAKIAGATGLVYKKNWGVDLLVGMTLIMMPFQIVSIIIHPSIFDFIFLLGGIAIAMYLIQFQPRAWISRVFQRQES